MSSDKCSIGRLTGGSDRPMVCVCVWKLRGKVKVWEY